MSLERNPGSARSASAALESLRRRHPTVAGERHRRRPDFRLVPAAGMVWAVTLAGLVGGRAMAVAAVLVAMLGLFMARRTGAAASGVHAMAACAAAAGVVVVTHLSLTTQHPLRFAAEQGTAATVRVVVTDDPRPVREAGYADRPGGARLLVVRARLEGAGLGDREWRLGGRIVLLTPVPEWSGLLPGQRLTADGVVAPAKDDALTVAVLRVRGPPREVEEPPWWQSAAGVLRAGLRDAASAALGPAEAGLLPGLAVGDTTGLPTEVTRDFRAAGLSHLTAVSGSNLAIAAGAVLGLLRLLRADPRVAAVAGGAAVLGFVILARPSPSVLRAAVMAAVALLALALGRSRSAVPALAAAVIALLLADPTLAVDAGFALSVAATAALVLVAPEWAAALRCRGVPAGIAEAFVVPAAACLATAPLTAALNGEVSLVAVVANLVAAPAVAPATILGVLAAVVSPLATGVAQWCAWLAGPPVGWLVVVADWAAAVPGGAVPWPDGVVGAGLLVGLSIVVIGLVRAPRTRPLVVAAVLGLALVLVPTRLIPPGWPPEGWVLVACDVGQGDALVLATGRPGAAVLVDAGPDPGLVDDCLDRLGVEVLELIVISHLHADHFGGLAGATRGRAVSGIAVGPVRDPAWALAEVADQATAAGVTLLSLTTGHRLAWPSLVLEVLGPSAVNDRTDPDATGTVWDGAVGNVDSTVVDAAVGQADGTVVNDGSLVIRATTPAGTILLTGDIELAAQADLVSKGVSLRADVLKMPHHGSRYTSPDFLDAVSPRAVLVSVGADNRYRHPDRGLLEALERAGAQVRRTDLAGDIAITSPGPAMVTRGAQRRSS